MTTLLLQSGDRQLYNLGTSRNIFYNEILNLSRQTASILGVSNWGKAWVPTPYKIFSETNDSLNNYLNSFSINNDFFLNNHKEFQGNILPYLSAYSILNSGGQLNFTRLTGLNLPNNNILKPGFKLENNYKIYLLTSNITIDQDKKGYYNCDETQNSNYYQGILISKNCELAVETFASSLITDYFVLKLSNPTNGLQNKLKPGELDFSDKAIQDKIFTFQNQDKTNDKIRFSFNVYDDFYWKNALNTNIQRLDDFGYVLFNYNDVLSKLSSDVGDIKIENLTLTELTDQKYREFQEENKYAKTPWFVSQGFYDITQDSDRSSKGLDLQDRVIKLFKIHALNPGKFCNNIVIKIIPTNVSVIEGVFSTFNLHLINKQTERNIYEFNELNLNPDDENFIGRVIGTSELTFDMSTQRITEQGDYPIQNPWVRVELSEQVLNKTIPYYTIPAGFLGVNKPLNNLNNQSYNLLNEKYTVTPQFSTFFQRGLCVLDNTHAWGKNLKTPETFLKNIFSNISTAKKNINSPSVNLINLKNKDIKVINYYNRKDNLIINRKNEENNYLNKDFYDNYDSDNYADMFHLEKIALFNEFDEINNVFRQYWPLSKYIKSGDTIQNVIQNNKFWESFFSSNTNLDKVYYYFTIGQKGVINNRIDTITEALRFDRNILNFNVEMLGGWDGLNLLNIDEYSINDKGLESSEYLRELYKIALEVINDEVNGQNEIIYLPEIFNQDVVQHAFNLISDNPYSLLLVDKPLYNKNNQIIYGNNVVKLNKDFMTRIEYKWSDQKYIYITNREVDNLLFDQNVTLSKWQEFTSSLNNVISFSNYIDLILPSRINSEINNSEIEHEYIVPSGLFAACALLTTRQTMNPIYNTKLNAFGELRVYYNIEDSIDYQNTKRRINISQVNDLNVNVLYSDIKTNQNVYTFFSDKTNEFYTNHTTLLSKLNVRNTLNDIKKTIKLSSYSALFSNIKSIKDITNQIKIIYSNAMSSYLRRRLISNFKIQLDEKSTSKEDIAEGIVRGAIYIQFPNQETTNINI